MILRKRFLLCRYEILPKNALVSSWHYNVHIHQSYLIWKAVMILLCYLTNPASSSWSNCSERRGARSRWMSLHGAFNGAGWAVTGLLPAGPRHFPVGLEVHSKSISNPFYVINNLSRATGAKENSEHDFCYFWAFLQTHWGFAMIFHFYPPPLLITVTHPQRRLWSAHGLMHFCSWLFYYSSFPNCRSIFCFT